MREIQPLMVPLYAPTLVPFGLPLLAQAMYWALYSGLSLGCVFVGLS